MTFWFQRPISLTSTGSLEYVAQPNGADPQGEYGSITTIPDGFGDGEFTFVVWVLLNTAYPTGTTANDVWNNWATDDPQPNTGGWEWYNANWLIDGHNNTTTNNGSFDLNFYGGGRPRWILGDGTNFTGVQTYPASGVASLLDDAWHAIFCIRRFSGASDSDLELWVDTTSYGSETVTNRVNLATSYWDSWTGFPANQDGFWFGEEKLSALGLGGKVPDFKGWVGPMGFYNVAMDSAERAAVIADGIQPSQNGYLDHWNFIEGSGSTATSANALTMNLYNGLQNQWSSETP